MAEHTGLSHLTSLNLRAFKLENEINSLFHGLLTLLGGVNEIMLMKVHCQVRW